MIPERDKRIRIGVFGSSSDTDPATVEKATRLGAALGTRGCIVVTGACSGLPYRAAHEAARGGSDVWGFSPVHDLSEQHAFTPLDDLSIYSRLFFAPDSILGGEEIEVRKKYRNVISTAHCDAGIIICGKWGTLHEFCALLDYGKVIGLLAGTGGIADALPALMQEIDARDAPPVLVSGVPEELVDMVFGDQMLRSRGFE